MKKILCALLLLSTVLGCAPANISAVMRGSEHDNTSMETRCVPSDLRSESEMREVTQKFDGWRLIYVSEFTTGNRFGTAGVFCFERPRK